MDSIKTTHMNDLFYIHKQPFYMTMNDFIIQIDPSHKLTLYINDSFILMTQRP